MTRLAWICRVASRLLNASAVTGRRPFSNSAAPSTMTQLTPAAFNKQDRLYPSLYQINTRVHLTDLSQSLGRSATLDDIPDAELDRLAEMGFDWIWLLS